MTQSIACPACGAPNEPEAGKTHIACSYCSATVTIPEHMWTKPMPQVQKNFSNARPVTNPEIDAPDLLRKAQPIAIGAWNLFAAWTWLRWLLPTCLVIFVVGFVLCVVLGALLFGIGSLQ